MENLISIVEIPTVDFSRAVVFYQHILNIHIEKIDMEGVTMGLFPADENAVTVALIHGSKYKASADGTIAYLNAGNDLQIMLDKITTVGGKTVTPKTDIGSGMGFYAMFIDSEGNKLGLYSKN
jgi:predicted enzyme related to lactoylglutathione lyase